MIRKIHLFIDVFLAACAVIFYFLWDYRGNKIDTITAEKNECKIELKGCRNEMANYIEADKRANNTIGELRTVVKTVKSPCDCYNSIVDPSIVGRVRGE